LPPQWLPADPTLAHYRKLFEEVDFFRHFIIIFMKKIGETKKLEEPMKLKNK